MARAVALVLVIAGGAALADPLETLTLLPKLPARIDVAVVDGSTDDPVVEATVVAYPMFAPRALSDVKVTDQTGHVMLEVESGPTRLMIMYGDRTVESFAFSAVSARQMVRVPHVEMTVPPDPCPRDPNTFTTTKDMASLVSAVVAHAPQMADGQLLTKPVIVETRPGVTGGRGAEVMKHSTIERNAERTGRDQPYLAIDRIQLGTECARIESRISIVQPRGHRSELLCCCSSTDVYWRRSDDSWVFLKNLGATCS